MSQSYSLFMKYLNILFTTNQQIINYNINLKHIKKTKPKQTPPWLERT